MSTPESIKHEEELLFAPRVRNTNDTAEAVGGKRGDLVTCVDWPQPEVVIAFIRNPVRRALSAYQHFFIRDIAIDRQFRYTFAGMGFTQDMSFSEFVDYLLTVDLTTDKHITPQFDDLIAAAGGTYSEYLLAPLELIGYCWPIMMDNVGLGEKVPRTVLHRNKGDYNPDDYLTPELSGKLRELYSRDYNLWEVVYGETREEISTVGNATH
jgi:hypothetical protein